QDFITTILQQKNCRQARFFRVCLQSETSYRMIGCFFASEKNVEKEVVDNLNLFSFFVLLLFTCG
uniref:hypothetical protein n=1 Tax=Bacillus sp. X1(2014) TaxID=1565991 RepID=UPI001C92F5B4